MGLGAQVDVGEILTFAVLRPGNTIIFWGLARMRVQNMQDERPDRSVLRDETVASALEASPATVCVQDRELRYVWIVNPSMGMSVDEVVGKTDHDLLDTAFADRLHQLKSRALESGEEVRETVRLVNAEREETHDLSIRPITDEEEEEGDGACIGVACVSMRLPDGQMTLADEANHRIKNSLMLAQGLLRMQRRSSGHADAREALREAEGKIQSISRFHGKLSEGGIRSQVGFKDYMESICIDLVETVTDTHQIQIETDVAEVDFDGPTALKLALIVSELVMNAVKHAPQIQAPLHVQVSFQRHDAGYRLCVEDNGDGLPADFNLAADSGVGLRVLQTLSADLATSMEIERPDRGARFVFDIPAP